MVKLLSDNHGIRPMSSYGVATSASMAGLVLGATEAEVRHVLGAELCTDRTSDLTIMRYDGLEVYLDEGEVTMVVATEADSVETAAGIRVGHRWSDLVAATGDLEYGEEEAMWVSLAEPRLWFRVACSVDSAGDSKVWAYPDQSPHPDAQIEAIFFMDAITSVGG